MKTLKVLGVDDERGMREGIMRALQEFTVDMPEVKEQVGFDVILAETGEQAVELIASEKPDILLLDYKLPGINGLEVLDRADGNTGDMLPIMITAYASIETAIAATKQGAYDFLPKPFTPADLRHTVRKAATRIILARKARELEDERKLVRFEFIRVLGHELKAPLSSVASYMYLFKDHILGDKIDQYDDIVIRCLLRLDQMNKLIVDLLDMTRLESGQRNRKVCILDVREAAESAIDLARVQADKRGISITLDSDPIEMMADRQEIDMILNNLISNAVKYNRDDGAVMVSIAKDEDVLTLTVKDTGIGMTELEKQKLFGEFVRIRNEKTRDILGSGLGLSILKKITDLYEGTIDVVSEPDKGSTFTVTLKDVSNQER